MKSFLKILFFLITLLIFNTIPVYSQIVPDFKVNDDSTNYSQYRAKIGIDDKGNFVVVWYDQREGNNLRIRGQVFDSNANRVGNSFQVNNDIYTTIPSISVRGDGSFAVTWNVISLKFRLFNQFGTPLTDEIILEDTVTGFINALSCDTLGNFIVVFNQDSSSINNLYYQKLSQFGKKLGSKVRVSDVTTTSTYQGMAFTIRNDGNFVITWNDKRPPAGVDGDDIYFQMFDRFGNKIGINQKVNDDISTFNLQLSPKVSSDSSGNFVIAWSDDRLDNSHSEIFAQRYSETGIKEGNNFRVTQSTTSYGKGICNVYQKPNGEFLVGWSEFRPFIPKPYFQKYTDSGVPIGNNYLVTNEIPSSEKFYSDFLIFRDKIISLWSDTRNDPFDVYCNIRSFTNPDTTVNIIQTSQSIPEKFTLHQNFPNPFNALTVIKFDIKRNDNYLLELFNNLGQKVKVLVNNSFNPGKYEINFNSFDLSSGIYYYILSSPYERLVKSLVLLK